MPPAVPGLSRPLIVRLRNWVGDVTLAVPALQRLADAGFDLQLIGKGWAAELLAGQGWPVHKLPGTFRERLALLRRLHREARAMDPGFDRRLNTLCLPDSFSSAVECRLAGLRALGHAHEGRSPLLARSLPLSHTLHALRVYWRFADTWLGSTAPLPAEIGLKVSDRHRERARALRAAHGLAGRCIVICPFAGGTWSQKDKTWPGFAEFARSFLPTLGRDIAICPGPGEEAIAREQFAGAKLLPDVDLGTYAALLQDSALMIANDTGPGHMAAAVGTPLVSVLGPSDPALWHAWGPRVQIVQGAPADGGWPTAAAVADAVRRALPSVAHPA